MRWIEKRPEPASFTAWRERAAAAGQLSWSELQNPEKQELREALLREQCDLCCYCCDRVVHPNCHIEHLRPRSGFSEQALTYDNLLVSCQRDVAGITRVPRHCGKAKDNWFDESLFVSPLQPDCADYFAFTSSGVIEPAASVPKQDAARETIQRLALDLPKLRDRRAARIEAALEGIESWSTEEWSRRLKRYGEADATGRREAFSDAIVFLLGRYAPRSPSQMSSRNARLDR